MNIFELLIIQPVFNLLVVIYSLIPGGDFGVAIIIFTVLVRVALYPLTKSMLHQSRAMRKLQPELARIKKEAKGNRQLESMRMMELYKEHGVNPLRSIGILVIQLPIFIALYNVIRIFTQHRNEIEQYTYGFLRHLPTMQELILHPNHFNETSLGFISLSQSAIHRGGVDVFLLILAGLAGVTQYIMSKQTMPTSATKRRLRDIMADAASGRQADQSEMNAAVSANMAKILPFFMIIVMINLPGALALYYVASNMVAVAQQSYLLRQDEEELETIADSKPSTKKQKTSAEARSKKAKEASVTKIVANDSRRKKS